MSASDTPASAGGKAAYFEPLTKALELLQERAPESTAPVLIIEDEAHKIFSQAGPRPQHSWASLLKGDRTTI